MPRSKIVGGVCKVMFVSNPTTVIVLGFQIVRECAMHPTHSYQSFHAPILHCLPSHLTHCVGCSRFSLAGLMSCKLINKSS